MVTGTCAEGWHAYPDTGHCYLMVTDEADKCTWFEAQDKCRAMGDQADLMTVTKWVLFGDEITDSWRLVVSIKLLLIFPFQHILCFY